MDLNEMLYLGACSILAAQIPRYPSLSDETIINKAVQQSLDLWKKVNEADK